MNGIILIDKPKNFTSFDVVNFIKKRFELKKVGHAGTLDPLATGLLIILVGKATRLADTFLNDSKKYVATMVLGVTTDTFDITGKIIEENKNIPARQKIIDTLKSFEGEIGQTPPVFSALKYEGQAMYKLARDGKIVFAKKRKVVIHYIEKIKCLSPLSSEHSLFRVNPVRCLLSNGADGGFSARGGSALGGIPPSASIGDDRRLTPLEMASRNERFLTGLKSAAFSNGVNSNVFKRKNRFKYWYDNSDVVSNLPEVFFEVKCSKGTYIRSLCNDVGEILGCGAVLKELRRVESGKFRIKDAVTLDNLEGMKEKEGIEKILLAI